MQYWIMKNEPSSYSVADLKRDTTTVWDGVRNYQVRNMFRDEMRVGDRALFYHSKAGTETGIAGVMEIVRAAYPDPTQYDSKDEHFDPKSKKNDPTWLCVDVKFLFAFKNIVTLPQLKSEKKLQDLRILARGNRLSVTPIGSAHFRHIAKLGGYNV